MAQIIDSLPPEQSGKILCCYVNTTSKMQVARISDIPNWNFERVVFPGQRLVFEAPREAHLEIHTGVMASAILTDTIRCERLCVDNIFDEDTLDPIEKPNKTPKIRYIVEQALSTGYLTIEAENQLRQLLTTRYNLEDFNAFMKLQEATIKGEVKQESRTPLQLPSDVDKMALFSESQVIRFKPQGHLNQEGGRALSEEIAEVIPQTNQFWVIDLAEVDFVDSSGLVVLVQALKICRQSCCRLALCNVRTPVRLILELTQLDSVFEIFNSYEDILNEITQNRYKHITHIQQEKALLLFTKVTRLKETANNYLSNKCPEKAKFCYYQIIDVLEILQEGLDINTRRSLMKSYLEIYQRIVAVSIYTNDFNNAFLYTEISRNRYLVERLSKQDAVLPITLPFNLYKKIKEANSNERKTLNLYNYELSNKQDKQLIAKAKEKWLEAKKSLENLYSQVSEVEPDFIAKTKVYPISFTDVQSLLQPNSAIIEFFFTEKVLIIMLILPGEEEAFTCEDLCIELKDNYLEEIVKLWTSNITTKTTSTKDIEIDENIDELPIFLNKLSEYLLSHKLQTYIPPNIKNLIIIPHKYLHLVPIHALWLNDNQRLIDGFSVSYFPSIQVWKICQRRQRQRELLLGIENPTQDKDLIFSKAEVASISQRQQFIQSQIISGRQASKAEILRTATHHHCFHFSGHAEYNFQNPLDSYLMLSPDSNDEDLSLNTILTDMQMPQADLVTLSACCTGVVDAFQPTDEYLGLPTGFLLAGAKAVVSSLWKVNSIATAFLLDEFYRQLDKTDNKAVALQAAQNWLRGCSASELRERAMTWDLSKLEPKEQFRLKRALKRLEGAPFENPYYWAAFILTGC
jgi:anti-anti-sigma factor